MFWNSSVFEKLFALVGRRNGPQGQASYAFSGVPGDGTTSPDGPGTIVETVTLGDQTQTIVFTAETSNPSLYQMTSIGQGNHTQSITPGANSPTYAFSYDNSTQTATITETIDRRGSTETDVYAAGSNAYTLVQDTVAVTNPTTTGPNGSTLAYSFAANGQESVTMGYGSHTFTQSLPLDPTATFTGLSTNSGSTPNTITESIVTGDSVVTTTFVGSQSAGYALSQTSTDYVPGVAGEASLNVNEFDRADFNFKAGTVDWIGANGNARPQSLTGNSHLSFTDLGAENTSGDFVGETIKEGQQLAYAIFYSSSGPGGEYMQVASGAGAAAAQNLTGLAAQIAAVNALHPFTT